MIIDPVPYAVCASSLTPSDAVVAIDYGSLCHLTIPPDAIARCCLIVMAARGEVQALRPAMSALLLIGACGQAQYTAILKYYGILTLY